MDNTNTVAKDRAVYIEPAQDNAFSVRAYFFKPDVRASIAPQCQAHRQGAIPSKACWGPTSAWSPAAVGRGIRPELSRPVHAGRGVGGGGVLKGAVVKWVSTIAVVTGWEEDQRPVIPHGGASG